MIHFLDFEASGLGDGSYPIEVGWVDRSGQGKSCLIRPATGWTSWSAESARLHGISRAMLERDGLPVDEVAAELVEIFERSGGGVYCDSTLFDNIWLGRIMKAAGRTEKLKLLDVSEAHAEACNNLSKLLVGEKNSRERRASMVEMGEVAQHIVREAGYVEDRSVRARHRALAHAQSLHRVWADIRIRVDQHVRDQLAARSTIPSLGQ